MSKKYPLPDFLGKRITQGQYMNWLKAKANHIRRDRKRGNTSSSRREYKMEIHRAVLECRGRDSYTGDPLQWELIGTYDNEASKAGRREYKRKYALLPTVDHVGDGLGPADFMICSWRTNDAKNDLSLREFVDLCRRVVAHSESNSRACHDTPLMREGKGREDSRTVAVPPTPNPSPRRVEDAPSARWGGEPAHSVGQP